MICRLIVVATFATACTGCGGSDGPTPSTENKARTTAPQRGGAVQAHARDVRIVLKRQGGATGTSRRAADPGTQRVTLVNHTAADAVLEASSASGAGTAIVPSGGIGTARWRPPPAPGDRIRSQVRVTGHPDRTLRSSIPVR